MMRYLPVVMVLLLSSPGAAFGQISIQIGLPSVRIGFDQVSFPQLVAVPGYPVYYDPSSTSNYFFYDGLYWVYEGDAWYASSWYNGPWDMVEPQWVPLFVLRVPVRYYRQPPRYFGGWRADEPPRWGERWGRDWSHQRRGWDRWDRAAAPAPAPLPVYQREYSGERYPRPEQQHALRAQNYRHEPRDAAVTRVYRAQVEHAARPPARQPRLEARPDRPKAPEGQPEARPQGRPERGEPRQQQVRPPQARAERPQAPEARPERPQAREAQPQGRPERPQAREPQPQRERPQAREQGREKDKDRRGEEDQQRPGRGEDRGRGRGD